MSMRGVCRRPPTCPRRWRDHRAQAKAAGADAFDQRALGREFHLQFAGNHLRLGFGVGAYVADDHLAQQPRADEFANAHTGFCGVVGDDGEALLALAHQFVDQPVGRAHAHEATDHQHRPVGDQRHRVCQLDALFHLVSPSPEGAAANGLQGNRCAMLQCRKARGLRQVK
jgi:hypothetical protein